MKKKFMAMVTAISMMTAAVPAFSQPVSAAYSGNFCVISTVLAEDGETVESYLLIKSPFSFDIYSVTAEEMELYLTEDSAQPQIGDVVTAHVELGYFSSSENVGYFKYSETSTFEVTGTVEEYHTEQMEFVVLRIYEPTGELLMQSTETGDRMTYMPLEIPGYELHYALENPEIGDTVSFIMHAEYERPFLPVSHTKGDGTIPELPEAVIDEAYATVPVIVIGPNLAVYDGIEIHGFSDYSMFRYGDTEEAPECGDVLMVDITGTLDSYPSQLSIPQNGRIVNAGSAADLYGTKTYTVTQNSGSSLYLTDTDGNAARFNYYVTKQGWKFYNSEVLEAEKGDRVTFMLDEEGRPAVPVSVEVQDLPTNEYIVIAVRETGDVVLKQASGMQTYYLMNDAVTETGKALRYGDVVQIEGWYMAQSMGATNSLRFWLDEAYTSSGCRITQTGSVFAKQLEVSYTVTAANAELALMTLTASDGEQFEYRTDFTNSDHGYIQTDMNWEEVQEGDQITMVTYQGLPCIPKPLHPYGDVNTDGVLNIADVLVLNKKLLAGASLPAIQNENSTELGCCDFDGDGQLTQTDVLGMLRRVVGIE